MVTYLKSHQQLNGSGRVLQSSITDVSDFADYGSWRVFGKYHLRSANFPVCVSGRAGRHIQTAIMMPEDGATNKVSIPDEREGTFRPCEQTGKFALRKKSFQFRTNGKAHSNMILRACVGCAAKKCRFMLFSALKDCLNRGLTQISQISRIFGWGVLNAR